MTTKLRFLLITIFLTLLNGCSLFSTTKTLSDTNVTVEVLISALNENKLKLKSMEAEARIAIDIRDMAQVGRNYIKIKMPSSVEMSIKGPLGLPISDIKIDSSYYIMNDYIRNESFEGNPQSISFSGISFSEGINEFIEVVTGLVTISDLEAKNIKNFRIDGKYYYFETSGKGITKFNWIDKEKLVLTKQIVTFSEENYKIEKRFEDFQIIDGIILPRIIHFISDEIGGSISMEYIDSRINNSEEIMP